MKPSLHLLLVAAIYLLAAGAAIIEQNVLEALTGFAVGIVYLAATAGHAPPPEPLQQPRRKRRRRSTHRHG